MRDSSRSFKRLIASCLVMILTAPLAVASAALPQQALCGQEWAPRSKHFVDSAMTTTSVAMTSKTLSWSSPRCQGATIT